VTCKVTENLHVTCGGSAPSNRIGFKWKHCWICTVTYQMVQSSVLCKQNKSSNITFLWDMMPCTSVKRNHATQVNGKKVPHLID